MTHELKPCPFGIHKISNIYSPNISGQDHLGIWCKAPAMPYTGNRIVAAWWVLTGRAFALKWPKTGELERATGEYEKLKGAK